MNLLKRQLSTAQIYGSGLAFILILLLIYSFTGVKYFLHVSLAVLIILMVWPVPFRYFGLFWFALGELLGYITGRFFMAVIFVLVVIPVSIFKRRSIRKKMNLGASDKGVPSFFITRNHRFSAADLIKPF